MQRAFLPFRQDMATIRRSTSQAGMPISGLLRNLAISLRGIALCLGTVPALTVTMPKRAMAFLSDASVIDTV